jgi:hypothetical protein
LAPSRSKLWLQPRLTFADWWSQSVVKDDRGEGFSRRKLVLALANKDGGVHVDPEVDRAYADLSRNNSLGWIIRADGVESPMRSPVPASVRQIGFELEYSLATQLPTVLGGKWATNPLPVPEIRVQHPTWDAIGELRQRLGDDSARVFVTQAMFNVVTESGRKPMRSDFASGQIPPDEISGYVRRRLDELDDGVLVEVVEGARQYLEEEGIDVIALDALEQIAADSTPVIERLKNRVGDQIAMRIVVGVMTRLHKELAESDDIQSTDAALQIQRRTNEELRSMLEDDDRLESIVSAVSSDRTV